MIPRLKLSDRITWSVLVWIFLNLLWLKFLERFAPLWIGTIVFTIAAVLFILFGPPPREELEEEGEAVEEGGGR